MTRYLATAAIAAFTLPLAASADTFDCSELSPERCAQMKAAASSEDSMNNRIYINGRLLDEESGVATTGPDGQVYIRMSRDYDLAPSVQDDPVAGTLTQAEIFSICSSGDDREARRLGLEC